VKKREVTVKNREVTVETRGGPVRKKDRPPVRKKDRRVGWSKAKVKKWDSMPTELIATPKQPAWDAEVRRGTEPNPEPRDPGGG